ncbi:Protein of unknown function [Cotesia congregata]|uniref:Uncharacterized protein n=1 Tax=Cotesia congregata TaxID=51543 RepID=A0A8J2HA47_COTCN|nr:Protein of unknown function [Cotesia congregata]
MYILDRETAESLDDTFRLPKSIIHCVQAIDFSVSKCNVKAYRPCCDPDYKCTRLGRRRGKPYIQMLEIIRY